MSYTDAEVKTAYAKSKSQLLAELGNAGVGFMDFTPNKDELVSAWLDRFAVGRECPLCGKPMGRELGYTHRDCELSEQMWADGWGEDVAREAAVRA